MRRAQRPRTGRPGRRPHDRPDPDGCGPGQPGASAGVGAGRRAARSPGPRVAAVRAGDDRRERLAYRRRRTDARRRDGLARPAVRPGLRQRCLVRDGDRGRRRGPREQALPVLRGWRDLNAQAPRQATFTASVGGDDVATVGFVWVGDPERGRRLLPAMRALGRPVAERVVEPSYVELQRMDDTVGRHALRRYSKGHYLRRFPDEAIEAFLLRGTADGRRENLPAVGLQAYGGAIADVPDQDAAFSHRGTLFEFGAGTRWTDPAEDRARMAQARRCAAALGPFASGVYVNALSDEGAEGVRRAYPPEKLARLTALKNAYDPHNVFHLNQNIQPTPRRSDRHLGVAG